MRFFFITRGVPSAREPQWGNFEFDQARALRDLGHEIVVLSVDARFRRYYRKFGITKSANEGITHYELFAGSIWGKVMRKTVIRVHIWLGRYFFMRLFNRVVKEEGMPDLLYAHYLGCCSMAIAAKREYGIPVVGIEHWSELGYKNIKPKIKFWAEQVYKNLDCLLAVSTSLRENILKNFGVDSVVVNNMIGNEFCFKPLGKKEKVVRFVTTGNLLPVKGFDNLITAFSQLHLPPDTWSLRIIGGGKEYGNLQQLIDKLGLEENIRLCGRKNREGVIEVLQDSDVYVMSSRSETFGVAAIEALACGLPVIATDCGGARDFLSMDNGLLCPVNDIHKLAEALFTMYKYHGDYNRAKIAKDCQKRFSSEAIGKQLERIFEEVISKSKQQ